MHGLLIGAPFLLAFSGGIVALQGLRADQVTPEGIRERVVQLKLGATAMAVGRRRASLRPAAAVVLAAGISCFALGLVSILAEASGFVSDALTLSGRVGPVSGLSTLTTTVFFVAWGAQAIAWRRADPPLARVAAVSGALVCFGLLGTFPPIFEALGG